MTTTQKEGYKTTQFWLSLLSVLVGAMLASGVFAPESWIAQAIGAVASALASMGYSHSRAMIGR